MHSKKTSKLNGIIIEFYIVFWIMIKVKKIEMLQTNMLLDHLPPRITKGLIALLYKGGSQFYLTNWLQITLLNISYKIFAKAL